MKQTRFSIRSAEGAMPMPKSESPGEVLSRAITEATRIDGEPGVWEVVEYEDVLYRVERLDSPKLDVRIYTLR